MSIALGLLQELRLEAKVTRLYLERVPFCKADYQPHPKSEKLGRLAIHLAEIISWWSACLRYDELDFEGFEPEDIRTTDTLLTYYDRLLQKAEADLIVTNDEDLNVLWSMRHGETVYFTLPKAQVLRIFCMNHLVHHRAQLGVYLRLLDIALPATYGPSVDDDEVILVRPFIGS